jgi:hypothetical protein
MSTSPHAAIARLSDAEILEIFDRVVANRGGEGDNRFLRFYGAALESASRRDFMILRPVSLILIAKYQLQTAKGAGGAGS